ncbi:hypothetical protein DPMN_054367 [Dreissena polymorpha]|uniref:Protein-tyrosine sulfotransferase n=1 Tax=Dreissena polymorpha TaxID=45954 RepID=A0A9D4HRI4_DREPO|nr:hypothetical protein DPMN_054367 [Dreissena polymorpha]
MEELKYWLTCDLEKFSLASLTDDFHRTFTSAMQAFLSCVRHGNSHTNNTRDASFRFAGNTSPDFQLCLRKARTQCLTSNIIILKLIRLSVEQAITLLPFFPNMKIIHLVRDPRAIINSRQEVGKTAKNDFNAANLQIETFSRLQKDLSDTKFLMTYYPSIIKLVQYEDIAEHPVEAAKDLYAFPGLTFDDKIERFVKSQTQSSSNGCQFCTQRRNSTVTSIQWRSRIKLNEAQYLLNSCKNSMSILGYLDLPDNQTLRYLSVPSRLRYNVTKALVGDDRF